MTAGIVTEPGKRSGQPCIRGLCIAVWDGLRWLAAGMDKRGHGFLRPGMPFVFPYGSVPAFAGILEVFWVVFWVVLPRGIDAC